MQERHIEECPSCRGSARVCQHSTLAIHHHLHRHRHRRCWVQCDDCHMRGPQVDIPADAIEMWNALPRRNQSPLVELDVDW